MPEPFEHGIVRGEPDTHATPLDRQAFCAAVLPGHTGWVGGHLLLLVGARREDGVPRVRGVPDGRGACEPLAARSSGRRDRLWVSACIYLKWIFYIASLYGHLCILLGTCTSRTARAKRTAGMH